MREFLIRSFPNYITYVDSEILITCPGRHGYNPADIVILTDDTNNPRQLPTRQNLIHAMRWLVHHAKTNDSLFFHCMCILVLKIPFSYIATRLWAWGADPRSWWGWSRRLGRRSDLASSFRYSLRLTVTQSSIRWTFRNADISLMMFVLL